MSETKVLEDVSLFMPDGSVQTGGIAFNEERIIAVGSKDQVRAAIPKNSKVISLPGAMVLPGLCDGHTHMIYGAMQLAQVDLRGVKNRDTFVQRIEEWMHENPTPKWVLGGQWDDSLWGGERPCREWLDEFSRDRPIFLTRCDMHSALVNSKALEIVEITRSTADPPGGRIVRDPETGDPTGLLLEKAMDLVADRMPQPTAEEKELVLGRAFEYAQSLGLTAVQDVILDWKDLEVYRAALGREENGLHVFARTRIEDLDRFLSARENHRSKRLFMDGVKGYVDGTLGSSTAWLEEPYAHQPGNMGINCIEKMDIFQDLMKKAALSNASVSLHAIGDAAISFCIEQFHECIRNELGTAPLRIEHFQHPTMRSIAGMPHPRIVISMQPAQLVDDAEVAEERLGPGRAALAFPIRSLLDRDCTVVFGSDWNVAELNPFVGMHAAVTRIDRKGRFPGGWHPEERIGIAQAIQCYSASAAKAVRVQDKRGRLMPGMEAHLTVIDRDITSIPPGEIPTTKVIMTVISGEVVFEDR